MSFRDFLRGPASVFLLVEYGREKGLLPDALLAGSHLANEHLSDPNLELTADQELRVTDNLLKLLNYPRNLGFDVGTRYHYSAYGLFGYGLVSSATTGDALTLALRFLPLTYAFTVVTYQEQGSEGVLTFAPPELTPHLQDFVLARDMSAAAVLLKELGGADFNLTRFTLRADPVQDCDNNRVLGLTPLYAAASNSLVFARTFLTLRLPQANAVTVSMCEQMCAQLMQRRIARTGMTALVQHHLSVTYPDTPDLCAVALLIHVSARTLKRRLHDEGTTFSALLAEFRSRKAVEMINDKHLSLTEIAERLGFSDLSSFSQAFKRWHGVAPSRFKLQKNAMNMDSQISER